MDRVAACAGKIADDAAACLLWADEGRVLLPPHSEQIELTLAELRGPLARQYLEACGLTPTEIGAAEREACAIVRRASRAILSVRIGKPPRRRGAPSLAPRRRRAMPRPPPWPLTRGPGRPRSRTSGDRQSLRCQMTSLVAGFSCHAGHECRGGREDARVVPSGWSGQVVDRAWSVLCRVSGDG
jgi:hypothetical protein